MNQYINEVLAGISALVDEAQLAAIRVKLVKISEGYDISVKSRELVEYRYDIPQEFMVYMVNKKLEGRSPATLELYKRNLEKMLTTLRTPLKDITANTIRGYLYTYQEQHGISNRSLDALRIQINGFFEWLANEGYIGSNPCRNISAIKHTEKPEDPLTEAELEMVRQACVGPRETALVEFLYSTGCRVSEACSVDRGDLNFETRELTVRGKGGKYRKVYLSVRCMFALRAYLNARDDCDKALFVSERAPHTRINRNRVEEIVKAIGVRAGVQKTVHPHLFRHTMATRLAELSPVQEVQKALGHSNVATTMIYVKTEEANVKASHARAIV